MKNDDAKHDNKKEVWSCEHDIKSQSRIIYRLFFFYKKKRKLTYKNVSVFEDVEMIEESLFLKCRMRAAKNLRRK